MKIKNFLMTGIMLAALITGCSKNPVGPIDNKNDIKAHGQSHPVESNPDSVIVL